MSRIAAAHLAPYRLSLRAPHGDARGGFGERAGVLLVLTDEDGREGIGDCAPLAPWSPPLDACMPALEREAARLDGLEPCAALAATLARRPDPACPGPVRAGVEAALGFLCSARRGVPLSTLLGGQSNRPTALRVNATIDAVDPDAAVEQARRAAAEGFTAFKVKVGIEPARDGEVVRRLREALGSQALLRVDANGGWSVATFLDLAPALRAARVELVEQPLAPAIAEPGLLARLRREAGLRVGLDESLVDESLALRFIDAAACDAVVVKPTLLGLGTSVRIAEAARRAGLEVIVTGTYESGAGYAAALEVAAACGNAATAHGLATALAIADDPVRDVPAPAGGTVVLPAAGVLPRRADMVGGQRL